MINNIMTGIMLAGTVVLVVTTIYFFAEMAKPSFKSDSK